MAMVDIDNNYYNIKGYQNGPRASFFFCHFFCHLSWNSVLYHSPLA